MTGTLSIFLLVETISLKTWEKSLSWRRPETTNMIILNCCFAEDDKKIVLRCVPHVQHAYFFLTRPIKLLICGINSRELRRATFLSQTAAVDKLFSHITCLHTTTFALLGIFSLAEMIRLKTLEKSLSWLEKCPFQFLFVAQKRRLLKLSTVDWQVLPQLINTLLLRFHENFITKIIKIFIKI